MKKTLLLLLLLLPSSFIVAQNTTAPTDITNQPITSTGISLPQLITTDLNRSTLRYGLNLSQGFNYPFLNVNFERFISNDKRQISYNARAGLAHAFSIRKDDDMPLYSILNISANLGADFKFFNEKDFFFQIATQNSFTKHGGITDFDVINSSNNLTIGIGKGRIDYVNDGAIAVAITEKLSELNLLSRPLTESEYILLVQRINELKNRRRFVNRSYPLTEVEEIQDLLVSIDVLDESMDHTALINDVYRYEPMINRTTGSQFKIGATGTFSRQSFFFPENNKQLDATISYFIHSPISSQWQYNKGVRAYLNAIFGDEETQFRRDKLISRIGIGIDNDLHFLVDNRTRISLSATIGYDFKNESIWLQQDGTPFYDMEGFYINTRTTVQYQITRTILIDLGISLVINKTQAYSGLSAGLNF